MHETGTAFFRATKASEPPPKTYLRRSEISKSEALEHVFGQRLREVTDVFLPEDGRTAERKTLFHVRQLQHQKSAGRSSDLSASKKRRDH